MKHSSLRAGATGPAVLAVCAVFAVSACTAPAPPRAAATPSPAPVPTGVMVLPAPTGGSAVGSTVLFLDDTSRPDPWEPQAEGRRLRVTLWYPAASADGERAPYMSAKESELLLKGGRVVTGAPYDILSKTETNAVKDAEPAGARRGLPLVVLSPGWTKPVATLTSLAEELASQGYVVAGIDHTYETYATTLADGSVAECVACDFDTDFGFQSRVVQSRASDVSFVLDQLTGSAWKGSALIDPARIAMVGQSLGGGSAVAAMVKDPRVRAGVNMDGTTYARIPKTGLPRPFMFLGNPQHVPGGRDTSWDRDWKLLTGWKRWLTFTGGEHQSFTDTVLMGGALGVKQTGTLGAERAVELTRTYVTAFLDRHLRGRPQTLLERDSPEYPEVTFNG
ncbi:alpha/beta hydrolase family protein [Nonomuraea soli]|uniref:Putative dienelactone hydrolase n=1 Tax=Nonomuraea soli TaxID=1032476 RepID=A0A7W0CN81_9ACTN|nr:alpha/beta hydrolase [Nonomuraea soli]MBA2894149.1 putative dienelactone hydrolase [Nonomuraea soli]